MKPYIQEKIQQVLAEMEGVPEEFPVELERPAKPEHGDLATNVALKLARPLRQAPRQIAESLVARLRVVMEPEVIASIEIAGPGFINFRFTTTYLYEQLAVLLAAGALYGRVTDHEGKRALVEYVSANPTGPLTVGHGRNAVLGDTIANLLEWTGYDVTREYYYNDAGRQMRVLAESVRARYLELISEEVPKKTIPVGEGEAVEVPVWFPEEGYLGEYIYDIARKVVEKYGHSLKDTEDLQPFKEEAEREIFAQIEHTLRRLGIQMDSYFNEHTLYENGLIWKVLEQLREKGYIYEKEGAVWFKTTAFGKEQDTVLVKSSGEPTYRLPDIAYHTTKFERGFDHIVDIFGADHIATYPDVVNALRVLGYDVERLEVVIYQFVTLVRGGQPVKMSTRKATYVTLDQLLDEVGEDVTRFFFLMRSPNTHLEFDLDRARETSEKNPVFYLQYAHARICSILRKAQEVGIVWEEAPDLSLLQHPAEIRLIKELLDFPDTIRSAARSKEPHRLINYLTEVARAFTKFYDECRIIGEEVALASARMALAQATRIVLRNGLTILGISAPERM